MPNQGSSLLFCSANSVYINGLNYLLGAGEKVRKKELFCEQ